MATRFWEIVLGGSTTLIRYAFGDPRKVVKMFCFLSYIIYSREEYLLLGIME